MATHRTQTLPGYEHYIPVKPDLSDVVKQLEWLRDNDEVAQVRR